MRDLLKDLRFIREFETNSEYPQRVHLMDRWEAEGIEIAENAIWRAVEAEEVLCGLLKQLGDLDRIIVDICGVLDESVCTCEHDKKCGVCEAKVLVAKAVERLVK